MSWIFSPALETFEDIRKDWDALNNSHFNHILLDSAFVGPLIRQFGGPHVMLATSQSSHTPGMALLIKTKPGRWETFQPSQAPLGLINFGHRDETGEALLELLNSLPGYPMLLGVLHQDPDYSAWSLLSRRPDIEVREYIRTARLPLVGSFEEFWESRSSNLKHNLARQRRRLADQGRKLELLTYRSPDDVEYCMREYSRLESQGWKANEGTAVTENNTQGRFYREVLEHFCSRGQGIIFQLLLDGIIVASDLCLAQNGMLIVLKTAYDETVERLSPALLMRQEILRQLHAERQTHVIEFYGKVLDWHTKWTNHFRTMYHLNCFRHRWVAKALDFLRRFQ
jgi:hypothetical protein